MKQNETKQTEKALATANLLLAAIVVLLIIGLILNGLIYSETLDLQDYVGRSFNAVYNLMGRMRVS